MMAEKVKASRIAQDGDTPTQGARNASFGWRYAYFRSSDSFASDDPGQDYLTYRVDETRFAFALCDGVSQSFFGHLAARLLGDTLLEWLWLEEVQGADTQAAGNSLTKLLNSLTGLGTALVRSYSLPGDMPPMVRDVLEEKRDIGSQSTFICGRIDLPGGNYPQGQLVMAWLGDSRLRLWGPSGERTAELGDSFHTRERWSTHVGIVGDHGPHVAILPLQEGGQRLLTRLMTYSDGAAELDPADKSPSTDALNEMFVNASASPTSDDISFLEVVLLKKDAQH